MGGEKDRKRDGLGEREKDITRGAEIYRGEEGEDRNGPVPRQLLVYIIRIVIRKYHRKQKSICWLPLSANENNNSKAGQRALQKS